MWVGELYLELHRATLTSQAKTKQGNRRSEHLLREAELWAATAAVRTGFPYPYEELDRIWKTVLLHQFHDILPGSSIAWVHREAEKTYAAVAEELNGIIAAAQRALAGDAARASCVFNAAPHTRARRPGRRRRARPAGSRRRPTVAARHGGGYVLDNGLLRVEIDGRGLVVSAYDIAADRETVAPGTAANLLQIHPDFPNMWDAWDVDEFYRNTVTDLTDARRGHRRRGRRRGRRPDRPQPSALAGHPGADARPGREAARHRHRGRLARDGEVPQGSRSRWTCTPSGTPSETQFGHVYRPTHTNTSWEAAKFEACNHRFVHLEEPGWGVALVNDSTYGHDVTRTVRDGDAGHDHHRPALAAARPALPRPGDRPGRAPLPPRAGAGRRRSATRSARATGSTCRSAGSPATGEVAPLVTVDHDAVVVSAVKLADDAQRRCRRTALRVARRPCQGPLGAGLRVRRPSRDRPAGAAARRGGTRRCGWTAAYSCRCARSSWSRCV